MTEIIIISSVIVSILTAIGGILIKMHMNKCKCGAVNCECEPEKTEVENKEPVKAKSLSKRISGIFKKTSSI